MEKESTAFKGRKFDSTWDRIKEKILNLDTFGFPV